MRSTVGVVTIALSGTAMLVVLARWRRTRGTAPLVLLAALGAALGAGALLLQEDPGVADWAVTLGVLAAAAPVHFRVAFGPPGGST